MHEIILPVHACKCRNSPGLYCRAQNLFLSSFLHIYHSIDWKKMLTNMSSHHLSILFSHLPGSKNNEYTPVLTVNLRQNVHMQKPLLSFLSVEFAPS